MHADCRRIRAIKGTENYEGYCKYFERRHQKQMYGFARIAQPAIGGVDIAAVFIQRDKFVATNLFFSKCFCDFLDFRSQLFCLFCMI